MIKQLFISPRRAVNDFIQRDRNRLVKPIVFNILTSLIYTLMQNYLAFEDNYIDFNGREQGGGAMRLGKFLFG